ncbi:MAG: structural protein P5 [Alistipes sp.]|nr:structural protein P5 [Alistipes sp.]
MPRGLRNNNPGNIKRSKVCYIGEVRPSNDPIFKQFESMAYGYRAMFMLLYTYDQKLGLNTIELIISRYAPTSENNTTAYVKHVSQLSGVPATSRISSTNRDIMIHVVAAMSQHENGVPAVMADVEKGWELFIRDIARR